MRKPDNIHEAETCLVLEVTLGHYNGSQREMYTYVKWYLKRLGFESVHTTYGDFVEGISSADLVARSSINPGNELGRPVGEHEK